MPLASLIDHVAALPLVWHILWAGLVVLSLALVVLSRTRWGQSKPMRKCAVLSLLAHVLLACFATTVQIVVTAEPPGTRPAIHVALVSGEAGTTDEQAAAPRIQPWEGLQAGPVSRPEVPELERTSDEAVAEPLAAPDAIGTDEEVTPAPALPVPETVLDSQIADASLRPPQQELPTRPAPVDVPPREAAPSTMARQELPSAQPAKLQRSVEGTTEPLPLESLEEQWRGNHPHSAEDTLVARTLPALDDPLLANADPPPTNQADSPTRSQSDSSSTVEGTTAAPVAPPRSTDTEPALRSVAEGSGPTDSSADRSSVFRHRHHDQRSRLVQEHGGSEDTEAAVERALEWLSRAQSADGGWDAARHGAGREQVVLGHNRHGAGAEADTGVTGLALLAFLGAGHTHRDGKYQREVQSGLAFLINVQGRDGSLAGEAELYARMYCHAMAAFALSEAYAMTGDPALREPVRKAAVYTVRSQHVGGGWRYRPGDAGDTSQLGWQLMALRSAEIAGITIPDGTWQRAETFLRGVSRGRAGGLAAYQATTGISRTMSAEATYCKLLLAERTGQFERVSATCHETAEYLRAELPGQSARANYYYWYYATLLLHLRQNDGPNAQQDWTLWNESLKETLLASQHRTGPLAGAWGSDSMWGGYGGRVYTTALAALCLETYYRYLPFLNENGPQERTALRPGLLHQRAFDTRGGPDRID